MLAKTEANKMPPTMCKCCGFFLNAATYQFVLDFSSTTSLNAAVNAVPFLLRLTAIVVFSTASQLAIYPGCALPIGRSGVMLPFSWAGS